MIMKKIAAIAFLALVSQLHSAEPRKFTFDCENWSEGDPPAEVFVVVGAIQVKAKDGGKALEIGIDPLDDANALLGDSANGNATIEARAFASKAGRSFPRFGVGVHGQSGYRVFVFPAKKEIQLMKGDELISTAPFTWKSETWVKVKLEVKKVEEKKWTVSAKAWPEGETEPQTSLITHEDATLKGQGKCSIWATPYSATPVYFDDVKIEIE